jgi:organic hydroperoxide reductase OsmC/OhrA
MEQLPHIYNVTARSAVSGMIQCGTDEGARLESGPPVQFGGEPGYWSPEHLLTLSVASCFILTFRAVAAASKLSWLDIDCDVAGTLDKADRKMLFTGFTLRVSLEIAAGADIDKALGALEKAEQNCLVTNSLNCPIKLEPKIRARH